MASKLTEKDVLAPDVEESLDFAPAHIVTQLLKDVRTTSSSVLPPLIKTVNLMTFQLLGAVKQQDYEKGIIFSKKGWYLCHLS